MTDAELVVSWAGFWQLPPVSTVHILSIPATQHDDFVQGLQDYK